MEDDAPTKRASARLATKRISEPIIDELSDDFDDPKRKSKSKAKAKKQAADNDDAGSVPDDEFAPLQTASGRKVTKPKTLASEMMEQSGGGRTRASKAQSARKQEGTVEEVLADDVRLFDPEALETLGKEYPDPPHPLINVLPKINKENPLSAIQSLTHPGYVHGLALSDDGELLASASTMGTIRIWDTRSWTLLQELRDTKEEHIEEFYVAKFSPDSKFLIAAGKLKLRDQWNEEEADNHITPGPIKIFDTLSGEVVARLEGHTEEILCVERVVFKNQNYLISCSQDGRIIKWPMNQKWSGLAEGKRARFISDLTSYYVFNIAFLPGSGNKYFVGACDDGVKFYDFETAQLLNSWEELYTCYCDCVKFVQPVGMPTEPFSYYLLTRGVELLKDDNSNRTIKPNTARLYRLRVPQTKSSEWTDLELVQTYQDKEYFSNSWPTKLTANGYYVFAPTSFGEVFVWNMETAQLTSTLVEHKDREVRQVLLHPARHLLFSCGHDSQIRVYAPVESKANGSAK